MYRYTKPDDLSNILGDSAKPQFIELLKTRWDDLHKNFDVFRYKINKLQERIVDGGYLLQLNPDRSSKRRRPDQIDNVCQPFDTKKFNFTIVSQKEILFNIIKEGDESDVHVLMINASPISRYHTLLCPSLSKCWPQVATEDSLKLALDVMFLAHDRDLRIGFNSLCGLASVNHLHYHLFLESHTLPIENAPCQNIKGPLNRLINYPSPGFCFQIQSEKETSDTAKQIFKLISYLLKNSIAHNIFITRGQSLGGDEWVRVVVWPRKSSAGVKQLTAFNIAVCELSGWFPVFDKSEYENLKTENLEQELGKWKVDNFDFLCEDVKLLY